MFSHDHRRSSSEAAERTPARGGAMAGQSFELFRRRRNNIDTAKATGGAAIAPKDPSQALAQRFTTSANQREHATC